jgi:hypothetical protein
MNVLFLDVDGVLNCRGDYSRSTCNVDLIPDRTLKILKRIVDNTGAKIILSSSWRFGCSAAVRDRLDTVGLSLHDMTTTETMNDPRRGAEIDLWLRENSGVISVAILDDDADAGALHPDDFFQTSFDVGLTDDIADRIIDHLIGASTQ